MRKSTFATSLCLIATLLLAACATATPAPTEAPEAKMAFAMVTDQAGLGDQGFNDITWEGLQQAATDFNAEAQVVESTEQAQYVPNLTNLVQQDVDLIVGVGFLLVDAMQEVAAANPGDAFALVDAAVEAPNVRGLLFREQEGSFLGGIISGLTTQTNTIGVVGGMEIPPGIR
ncbi:MAG: BMP family protein, partial [Anaerolineales bacterium]